MGLSMATYSVDIVAVCDNEQHLDLSLQIYATRAEVQTQHHPGYPEEIFLESISFGGYQLPKNHRFMNYFDSSDLKNYLRY